MTKTVIVAALLALSFTTGFTCSKNTPVESQPAQDQMAAPVDAAPTPAPEGAPVDAAPTPTTN